MSKEMVDEEIRHHNNDAGIVGVVFGILSLVFLLVPIVGLVLAVVGVIFAFRQNKHSPNSWSKAGLWLCGIGIVIGVVWGVYYIKIVIEAARVAIDYQQLQVAQGTAG